MKAQKTDIFDSLSELLQIHGRRLSDKLDGGLYTIEDLEAELHAIDVLVVTVKRRDEWLKQLLDGQTPAEQRAELLARFKAQRMLVTGNRKELERLRSKSSELLAKSVRMVEESKRKVDKLTVQQLSP